MIRPGTVDASLQRVDLTGNNWGIETYDCAYLVVTDSTLSQNGFGIFTQAALGKAALIAIDRSSVSRNFYGVDIGGVGPIYATITGSTIMNNGHGLTAEHGETRLAGTTIAQNLIGIKSVGVVYSQGNNFIFGNATEGPAPTVVGSK